MANWKFLDYKNRQDGSLNQDELENPDCDSSPVLFPDEDTPVKFVFEASLAQITRMLSALEKGAQLSYPDEWHNVWWSFVQNLECEVTICDEVAACIEENEGTQDALNRFLSTSGSAIPGLPISDEEAQADITPENIHNGDECDLDAAWGAALYLTQSGNRAITDFFERTETLTNLLERMTKIVGLIPAVGNTIENLAGFADELYDDLKENYAGAYDEMYEEDVACAIFCLIKQDCTLNIDDVIQVFADRLSTINPEFFATVITFVGTGTFTGQLVADAMYYLYFTALKFGQQFGGAIGIRPLTQLMGLGADQLASNNWETLCDCPEEWEHVFDFEFDEQGFTAAYGHYEEDVGFVSDEIEAGLFYEALSASNGTTANINYLAAVYDMSGVTGAPQTDRIWTDTDSMGNWRDTAVNADGAYRELVWTGADTDVTAIGFTAAASACVGAFCGGQVTLKSMTVRGVGIDPY